MHLYRLVGQVVVHDFDLSHALAKDVPCVEATHILAVNVLWPDPLTEMQVEAHVMADLLREHDYSHDVDWEWTHGPEVREISQAEQMRALGVPEMFILEGGE